MHTNFCSTLISLLLIQLTINGNRCKVEGQPLNGIENQQMISRIYNDEAWSNNQNEQEYRPRNSWLPDTSDSRNNRKNLDDECKGSRTCGTINTDTQPIKREMFVSRGWGAGGMPFNVLYMKNPKSNKSLRSSASIIAEPLRSQPISQAQQQFLENEPNMGETASNSEITSPNYFPAGTTNNQSNNNRPKGRSSNNMLIPPRRHYSIIPQLFVSYGWGPIGK